MMKLFSRHLLSLCLILSGMVGLTGCSASGTNRPKSAPLASGGVAHSLVELDQRGNIYTNRAEKVNKVDAHSTLVVLFPKSLEATSGDLPPEWRQLTATLDYLNQRGAEWNELNQRQIAPNDSAAKAKLRQDAVALDDQATNIVGVLIDKLGFSQAEATDIFLGRGKGIVSPSRNRNAYFNLAQWATNNWNQLRSAAEAYERQIASNRQVMVTLQATRRSVTGDTSLLHVENWDNLSEGVYSPIDRSGLRPTEAEQKRLAAAREATESVIALIRAAQTNQAAYKSTLKNLAQNFESQIATIQNSFIAGAETWTANPYETTTNKLHSIIAQGPTAAQSPALAILTNLQAFHADFLLVSNTVGTAEQFKEWVHQRKTLDPIDVLLGGNGLVTITENLLRQLEKIGKRLPAWPEQLKTIADSGPKLAAALASEELKILSDETQATMDALRAAFPTEVAELNRIWTTIKSSQRAAEAEAVLAAANDQMIPRTLDNLAEGRINLKYGGLAFDDLVTVRLRATNTITGQWVDNLAYEHEIGFMGLYGKPVVHLIFTRATDGSGEAAKWKPNVAAGVEWHYQFRLPEDQAADSTFERAWNWFNPGAGLHVASLDQGADSVEIGSGLNVSLWDGLVAVGYGYNFGQVDENQYVFIGINLLSVLGKAKTGMLGR